MLILTYRTNSQPHIKSSGDSNMDSKQHDDDRYQLGDEDYAVVADVYEKPAEYEELDDTKSQTCIAYGIFRKEN